MFCSHEIRVADYNEENSLISAFPV